MKNKQSLWIVLVVILVIIVAGAGIYIFRQQDRMRDLLQQSELVKEELADEYNDLVIDYEGFRMKISNDSLIAKLETEQMKVQRLQEELRTVKATNTKRINELKKELETLRVILKNYVQQIDSLNRINEKLTTENRQVTARYQQATQTVSQLTKEKEHLTETVQLASKLSASGITVNGLNDKNKVTDQIKKMVKIEVRFVINKNITAPPGEKTIYIRIMKPDDDVLIKSRSNVFAYENKEINYSSKRTVEYEGEELPVAIYWDIEEYLSPGTYRVDIFAGGNLIGKKTFRWDK
jgi:predicted nuclease with TOPRIM domain